MKKLIPPLFMISIAITTAIAAGPLQAGTLTIDGNNCGFTTAPMIVDPEGNITITSNGVCRPSSGDPVTGPWTLTVSKNGTGTGTITSDAAGTGSGIQCGANCSEAYANNTVVTLTATAASSNVFAGWSGGGCSGTGTCAVTMNAAKTVAATFNTIPPDNTTCPTGVTCIDRPWPVIAQEKFNMRASGVMAIRIKTTAEGVAGRLITDYTTGSTASRQIALSTKPGDFAVASSCLKWGLEHTTHYWQQGGSSRSQCILTPNSIAYINIRFTNCAEGTSCNFFLSGTGQ